MSKEKEGGEELPAHSIDSTKKGLTTEQKLELFAAADEATEAVKEVELALEEAKGDKSEAIKNIFDACGKGPFRYKGRDITIVARKKKGVEEVSYLFREQPAEVEEIG